MNGPDGFERTLGELPEPVALRRTALPFSETPSPPDALIFFTLSVSELQEGFMKVAPALKPDAALWVAWPKKASGMETDMTEDRVRDVALPAGMVDNKVCAIDETWSGLRLVVRKENRANWPTAFHVVVNG